VEEMRPGSRRCIFRRFTRTNRDKPPRARVHSCRQKIGGIKLAPLVLEIFF
jgi:hypothetical protein